MQEDFDEDTLENIVSKETEVIGPIAEMRRKKQIEENTFVISRENYENSSDEQIEAWFTKFDDVIIDDSKNPYKDPLTKKELVFKILDKMTIENLNKGIDKFNKGVNQFSKVIASSQPNGKRSKMKIGMSQREYDKLFKPRKGNTTNFWNEDKKTRKKRNKKSKPVQKEKHMPFYGSKKVKFF